MDPETNTGNAESSSTGQSWYLANKKQPLFCAAEFLKHILGFLMGFSMVRIFPFANLSLSSPNKKEIGIVRYKPETSELGKVSREESKATLGH